MKTKLLYFSISLLLLTVMACNQPASGDTATKTETYADLKGQSGVVDDLSAKNILQIAISSKDHSTLVAAVQATQLENVLVNAGPLTVFAPTNEAFDQLPEGTVETLLKPENKATLARIIKFHASPGKYTASLLKDGMNLFQASGHYVKVLKDGDNISINGANIVGTVEASNGLIHVIDKVILPPDE